MFDEDIDDMSPTEGASMGYYISKNRELREQNEALKQENQKLKEENKGLKDTITELQLRRIDQTADNFSCPHCKGRGCHHCNGSGSMDWLK